MITVKHPLARCNEEQEKFLAQAEPSTRRYHELLFIMGNATYRYHNQTLNPAQEDWQEFIEGLNEPIKSGMEKLGFEKGKSILPFTRYVLEKNDIGLDDFIKEIVPETDMLEYNKIILNGE